MFQNATAPFTLGVAVLNETLTVSTKRPLVDAASSQVLCSGDRRQMEQLPLQGRNWMGPWKLAKGA